MAGCNSSLNPALSLFPVRFSRKRSTYPAVQTDHAVILCDVDEHLQHVFPGAIVGLRLEADL